MADLYDFDRSEHAPPPLDYMTEQRLYAAGWRKGMPPKDPADGVRARCMYTEELEAPPGAFRRCVHPAGHGLAHCVVYAGADSWYREVPVGGG